MSDTSHLLDDDLMRRFIVDGYVMVQTDLPPSFHQGVYRKLEKVFDEEGNPGNNILPRVPEIQRVFETAPVRGALKSLLGPDYLMHPHRYCHLNRPGSEGQRWHKDDYVFDKNVRHHRYRWVMAFYYPQGVTEDMGPTAVLPGRQYYNTISDEDPSRSEEPALSLRCPAGTVAIVNFDSWHRATANVSREKKRYMLKFQFTRMHEPLAPSWRHTDPAWRPVEHDRHPALSRDVWAWLSGHPAGGGQQAEQNGVDDLIAALGDTDEGRRLEAAYALGAAGERVVPALIEALQNETEAAIEQHTAATPANPQGGNPSDLAVAHALTAAGAPAIPALIDALDDARWWVRATAADVLGNFGSPATVAVSALRRLLGDENMWVRRNAAEALGTIGPMAREAAPALVDLLRDDDELVRLNAAIALARIGHDAPGAVPALTGALNDENRYIRYYALAALHRIDTPEAREALWKALITARWCPITTKETPY